MSVDARVLLAGSFEAAWRTLEATMADVSQELAERPAPGRALGIGAAYAHAVIAADNITNGMLAGRAPLGSADWAGRTGVDLPMPMPGGGPGGDLGEWYRSVRVDLAATHEYAGAVWASVGTFIASTAEPDLARSVDMSFAGAGQMPVAIVLSVFVTGHVNNLTGEISAIKGAHGLQGYPF